MHRIYAQVAKMFTRSFRFIEKNISEFLYCYRFINGRKFASFRTDGKRHYHKHWLSKKRKLKEVIIDRLITERKANQQSPSSKCLTFAAENCVNCRARSNKGRKIFGSSERNVKL